MNWLNINIFCFKLLSRTKAADDPAKRQELQEKQKNKLPELEDFIMNRDYSGATALLDVSSFFSILNFYVKMKTHLFFLIL